MPVTLDKHNVFSMTCPTRLRALFCCGLFSIGLFLCLVLPETACHEANAAPQPPPSHQRMIDILGRIQRSIQHPDNLYASETRIAFCDSVIRNSSQLGQQLGMAFLKAGTLLEYGDEAQSVALYKQLLQQTAGNPEARKQVLSGLGVACLRLAERNNCVAQHGSDACIMPIRGNGIHQDQGAGRKCIEVFQTLLTEHPDDLDARWLLNIAYMTLGEYPKKMPARWLIPGLEAPDAQPVKPFYDIAGDLGIASKNRAGGSIVEDLDKDGDLDIVGSAWGLDDPMHFYRNEGNGSFTDRSGPSGLSSIGGGLNMTTTDYNNDGWIDIFVLRGGWQGQGGYGRQPNSLLRNNGDGTFTDITESAGLLSYHPTQAAAWNDFNNDGWLDVFIGNETADATDLHPCELYINNRNGTFTNIATPDVLDIKAFVKGVASGDYDNDGWADLVLSTMNGQQILLHNRRLPGQSAAFELLTRQAGLPEGSIMFPTGFFDYDNDGWLDIFFCNYEFTRPLSYYCAKEALQPSGDMTGKMYLFHNNHDGTFSDVSKTAGVNKTVFAMGANFGDIDNDGYLDLFFGTGNPNYRSLLPNRLYKNLGGKKFVDVTNSARVGNLQKGHGVSFADIDNDGDQDIHVDMGGAFRGDAYPSSLFINPGQSNNNWIYLELEGLRSNRLAIGARILVKFRENGVERQVYREVNSGASFGCSPLRREIGIGQAAVIDELTVIWPASQSVQVFKNIKADQVLHIREGQKDYTAKPLRPLALKKADGSLPMCAPAK